MLPIGMPGGGDIMSGRRAVGAKMPSGGSACLPALPSPPAESSDARPCVCPSRPCMGGGEVMGEAA